MSKENLFFSYSGRLLDQQSLGVFGLTAIAFLSLALIFPGVQDWIGLQQSEATTHLAAGFSAGVLFCLMVWCAMTFVHIIESLKP